MQVKALLVLIGSLALANAAAAPNPQATEVEIVEESGPLVSRAADINWQATGGCKTDWGDRCNAACRGGTFSFRPPFSSNPLVQSGWLCYATRQMNETDWLTMMMVMYRGLAKEVLVRQDQVQDLAPVLRVRLERLRLHLRPLRQEQPADWRVLSSGLGSGQPEWYY